MLTGPSVVRIEWLPGTDPLLGTCLCGAQHRASNSLALSGSFKAANDTILICVSRAACPRLVLDL